jgi:hypothetical protein
LSRYLEEIEGLVAPIVAPHTSPQVRETHLGYFRDSVPPLEAAVGRANVEPLQWRQRI